MIKLNVQHLLFLGILTTAVHWLIARSSIMSWLWSRARGTAAKLLACPACSGWWLGLGASLLGFNPVIWTDTGWIPALGSFLTTGLLAMFLTPVFEGLLIWGLETSHIPTTVVPAAAPLPPPTGSTPTPVGRAPEGLIDDV